MSVEILWQRGLIAVIGLAVIGIASLDTHGAASQAATPVAGAPSARSAETHEVEAAIAGTNLTGKIEAALGEDFAGVWFAPSTGRLHVGVISSGTRRTVDAVAAQVGLADVVAETPVRSTWVQLQAAQERWGARLKDLLHRTEVATALSAKRNSLVIELTSSVSPARRSRVQRAAAVASVPIWVVPEREAHISFTPASRCNAFKPEQAFCDPTIVGGVFIKGPLVKKVAREEGAEGEDEGLEDYEEFEGGQARAKCTAGPAVIVKKPADKATATKTYILTAGHCIDPNWSGGGVNGKWVAYNKEGLAGEKEIGPAVAYLHDETDVGVIEVTTNYWARAKDTSPVTPTIAPWAAKETDPYPVIQQFNPVEGLESCMAGQRSGLKCGEVTTLDQQITVPGAPTTKNLVEVKGLVAAKGDSGAPTFEKAQFDKSTGYVEGTAVGIKSKTGYMVFQSLKISFEKLKASKSIDLELLTKSNEVRHLQFKASAYPVTASAKDTSTNDQFTAFGAAVKCTENEFNGEMSEPGSEEVITAVEITPSYSNCSTLGLPVKVVNNGCKYKFTLQEKVAEGQYRALVDVVCPTGKPGIQFLVYANHTAFTSGSPICTVTMPPQSGLKALTLTNSSGDIVVDSGPVEGARLTIKRGSFLCPGSGAEAETTSGVYHVGEPVVASGFSGGKEVEIEMAGQ